MDILTRRGFLGSLAFGSIYPNVEQSPASQLQAMGGEAHPSKILWSIGKRNSVAHLNHVDFWSKPRCAVKYADQLPSEIGRGALFYGEAAELSAKSAPTRAAISLEKEYVSLNDRFSFQHGTGIKTLAKVLRARVDANAKSSRVATTALIALDSQWSTPPGPDWTDILSAFRGCYDRLIGHYHINQRGFHHWKNWMTEGVSSSPSFDGFFTSVVSQCDAVVFTSQSLLENDVYLSARASTESLVGELMQRFAQVLSDEKLVQQIIPIFKKSGKGTNQPRMLALSSAGASSQFPTI